MDQIVLWKILGFMLLTFRTIQFILIGKVTGIFITMHITY